MRRKARAGHLIRNSPWINAIAEGKIEGKPGSGRSRIPFLKQVMEGTGIRIYSAPKRNIGGREKWSYLPNLWIVKKKKS